MIVSFLGADYPSKRELPMDNLYNAAVLLLLIVGLGLAAAHNAGVSLQFADDVQTPSYSPTPDDHSHPAESHSDLTEHGHTHGFSGD